MAQALNSSIPMRISLPLILLAVACRREMPPRDYQNNPPAMTHPVTSSAQSPTQNGLPNAAPEPSKGAEGKNVSRKPTSPVPAQTLTLPDQAPANTTTTATTSTRP